jgi:hypothetical protein
MKTLALDFLDKPNEAEKKKIQDINKKEMMIDYLKLLLDEK